MGSRYRCRVSPSGAPGCNAAGTGGTSEFDSISQFDFYTSRTNIQRSSAGPFTPLVFRETLPGTDPIIYAPLAPVLVTIYTSVSILAAGAGGEITLDVITHWGSSDGTNTFFRIDAVGGKIYRLSAISGILIPPPEPNPIIVQWTAVALPPGCSVQIDSDTTQDGAYMTVQYFNGIHGELRA